MPPLRDEQMEAVGEILVAASMLLHDWTQGSVQRTRVENCGDSACGYASCRLADAIKAYLDLADE